MKDIGGKSFLCCLLQTSKSTPVTQRASEELLAEEGALINGSLGPSDTCAWIREIRQTPEQCSVQGRQRLAACRNSCKEQEIGSSSLWDRIMGCKGEPESEGAFCSTQAKNKRQDR